MAEKNDRGCSQYWEAESCFKQGEWKQALCLFDEAINEGDDFTLLYNSLQYAAECCECIASEIRDEAKNKIYSTKAYHYRRRMVEEFIKPDDDDAAQAFKALGDAAFCAGLFTEAVAALSGAIAVAKNDEVRTDARLLLADVLIFMDRDSEAEVELRSMDVSSFERPDFHIRWNYCWGTFLLDAKQARCHFRAALKQEPESNDPMSVYYVDCAYSLALLIAADPEEALTITFLPFEHLEWNEAVDSKLFWLRDEIINKFIPRVFSDVACKESEKGVIDLPKKVRKALSAAGVSQKAIMAFCNGPS